MNASQAHGLVREIDASWNYPFRSDQVRVAAWTKILLPFDHVDAAVALETAKATYRDRPSPAQFGQDVRAVEVRRKDYDDAQRRMIDPAPSASRETARYWIDRIRDELRGATGPMAPALRQSFGVEPDPTEESW